jgi:Activator of Hsp90 ATPase homolog 1-like protein
VATVTVTFVEHDGKTALTVHHVGIPAGTEGDMAEVAWIESLQHLQEILAETK